MQISNMVERGLVVASTQLCLPAFSGKKFGAPGQGHGHVHATVASE
jgi:hypothetical protein